MSIGGRIIEIRRMTVPQDSGAPADVVRLWCVDRDGNEICVYAEPQDDMPALGDNVWWHGGKIYFDGERRHLHKLGYSFGPHDHMDAA